MAVKVFHSDAKGFGLLSSIMAVGTISGALLAAGRDKPRFGSLLMGAAVFGLDARWRRCLLAIGGLPDLWC